MAPLMDNESLNGGNSNGGTQNVSVPRLLIIGAGHRGNAYARAVVDSGLAIVAAVADPVDFRRSQLGARYIWNESDPSPEQEFKGWKEYIKYEQQRRKDEESGVPCPAGINGVFICVRDEHHTEVITAFAPLGLHIMSEKPLATTLADCLQIEQVLKAAPKRVFAIGHVLRYSPHNMLLRHLVRERKLIGEILSIEHTEPVGWWHFSHAFVRGNWRKESTTAPSLLTKSCHDIDFILWMLCSPAPGSKSGAHLPARLSSHGSVKQFRRSQKPEAAGTATNCLSCPLKETCNYSATRIYNDRHLAKGKAKWPVDVVNAEIESIASTAGPEAAQKTLMASLAEDYNESTPLPDIESRSWYGRCVWEADNDVCDDQYVTMEWDDDPEHGSSKTASFHMIAQTLAQCERRGRIYGTSGEISYDSKGITVHDFETDTTKVYHPEIPKNSHHGGGDDGLTQQYIKAVIASMDGTMEVDAAQVEYLGCTMEEIIRSHAVVFAAEEGRRERKVVEWAEWWGKNVDRHIEA